MATNPAPVPRHDVARVRRSFAQLAGRQDETAARFYARLFALDPALRGLFHGDMREQGRKLVATLGFIAENLGQLERLLPTVRQLGVRHAGYRVEERHYALVGEALLGALGDLLGADFDAATRDAWAGAYALLAGTMIEAAATAGAAAR